MKKISFIIFMLSCFVNFNCSDSDTINIDSDNLLLGNWVEPIYDGEKITFKRANELPDESYGISFMESGDLIERSSGWCGTPPLFFSDYEGEWKIDNDLITVDQMYIPFTWRIVSLTENELVVKYELVGQEKDYRALMDVFDEIYQLSISVSCTDENDWAYTAYGSKACGGPQGYIAYSNKIDTDAFLQKVNAYSDLEHEYNVKWSIISTCDLPSMPSGIKCENGLPILVY